MQPVVHGLILTGGGAARFGADKLLAQVAGVGLAARAAAALRQVADPVLAVGRDAGTGLEVVADPGAGPLAAFAAGCAEMARRGADGAVLLVAGDLPFLSPPPLTEIVAALGAVDAAVPVFDGRDQPLAACYAPRAREVAHSLGGGAMRDLLSRLVVRRIPADHWGQALFDVDTPDDLAVARRMRDAPA